MHKTIHTLKSFGWRRIAFSLVVLAYLGFLGFINVLMFVPGNWLSPMGHFDFVSTGDTHNLIHELVFALIVGTAAVGLFSQLWKPKENFEGQLVALIAWVAMIVIAAFTNNWVPQPLFLIFGGLTLIATILHPAGLGLFNWIRTAKVNKILLTLIAIAAVPLTAFAFTNINLQIAGGGGTGFFHNPPAFHGGAVDRGSMNPVRDSEGSQRITSNGVNDTSGMTVDDEATHDQEHVTVGHYRNMAVFSFIVILVGLLASFRIRGWRLAAWVAGFLPILLGLASVALPDAESSLGLVWGLATVIWGVAFITVAELTRRNTYQEITSSSRS